MKQSDEPARPPTPGGTSADGTSTEPPPPDETAATRGLIEERLAMAGMTPERVGAEAYEALVTEGVRNLTSQTRGQPRSLAGEMAALAERRAERMAEMLAAGMPLYASDEPEPEPCPECGGARFVRTQALHVDPGGRAAPVIESEGAAIATVEAAKGRIMPCPRCTRDAPEYLLAHSGLPARQRGWTLAAFEAHRGKVGARVEVVQWVEAVIRGEHPSLLLVGGPGTGKSHLASAAVIALCEAGVKARWAYVPDMLDALRPGGSRDTRAEWEYLRMVPVLALDDIAADQLKEWAEGRITALIHDRLHAGRPTIVTTDLGPGQLSDQLGGRLASRLREYWAVVVGGEDMRGVA